MAKIRSGALLGQASGAVGNIVFSHNRGGAYIRARSVPVNTMTPYRDAVKAAVAAASSLWATLDFAERNAWSNWAGANPVRDRLGENIILQPNAAFVGLTSRQLFHELNYTLLPPAAPAPPALQTAVLEADIGTGDFALDFTPDPVGADLSVEIWGCLVNSDGRKYVTNLLRFIVLSAANAAAPLDIQTAFSNRIGVPAVGQYAHVWARTLDRRNGQVSGWSRTSAAVVSTT